MKMLEENVVDGRCMCQCCEDRTKETYRLAGQCSNCGWSGQGHFRKGDKPPNPGECPNCGCRTVSYRPLPGTLAFGKSTI